ncbi:hypothetical protein [Flavobacterium sp.]|uniref:hypothetical protein n=1 Tax=Flavobacterium sp. TaxID=239 RepID=UPI0028BEDFCB|nr:hypothetical protein [Flavobacterium sp.]
MRYFFILPLTVLFSYCKCTQPSANLKKEGTNTTELVVSQLVSSCPDDGKCTLRIENNKELVLKTDGIGKLRYELIDNFNTSVVVFEYKRDVPEGVQDGSYREMVIFEINNTSTALKLTNSELKTTKMLFGRFCYCKGYTGLYFVKEGTFDLVKSNDVLDFNLQFTITEVPQIINSIQTKNR